MTKTLAHVALIPSAEPPVVRLTCRAPHRDPKRKGEACSAPLGDDVGSYDFVTLADRLPDKPDGYKRIRCPSCDTWNVWKPARESVALVPAEAPPPPPPDPHAILASLPPIQQPVALALAGGITATQIARTHLVSLRTIQVWKKTEAFAEAVRSLAPIVSEQHSRIALEALLHVIEKDRKKGVAHNARWFLSRTVFANFEQTKAAAGGTAVSVNVQQSQQQTQASIRGIWEDRQRVETATVADKD